MLGFRDLLSAPQPSAPMNEDDSGGEGSQDGPRTKKSRRRQQLSCSACHARKQKCDRGQPCDRCVKRGQPELCVVMPAGEGKGTGSSRTSPPVARKRKQPEPNNPSSSGDADLAERVRQLEQIIKNSASLGSSLPQFSPPVNAPIVSPSLGPTDLSVKKEDLDGEEQAVAALSTLAKAIPNEGGTEARIYSGPGSLATILEASGFARSDLAKPSTDGRARPSDYQRLYSGGPAGMSGMLNAHPRLAKLQDAVQEQRAKLPPPVMAHWLWSFFHNCNIFSDKFVTFPRGAYQAAYDELFEPKDRDTSQEAQAARVKGYPQLASAHSLAFISQVFAIFALSLALSPDQSEESKILSLIMYENSRSAFMASERREQPTYSVIMAVMLQSMCLKLSGQPSQGFTYVAQAIRFGQSMGLHRAPGPAWDLSPFEVEVRKRIWWSLVIVDKHHSLSYGRPYSIFERHCDTPLPSNVDVEDLLPTGARDVKPDSEVTTMTANILMCKFSKVVSEIIDQAFSCTSPTYTTIVHLDRMITDFEHNEIPKEFSNPTPQQLAAKPYIQKAYAGFSMTLSWLRTVLHRPYLLQPLPGANQPDHYIGSRAIAVTLSKRMIEASKETLSATPKHLQTYFACAFNAFEPAVTLSTAILQDPGSANASTLDFYVQEAMALLESMTSINPVAVEGLETLQSMREKYLAAMQASKGRSPNSSVSLYSSSDPSPSLYASSGPSPLGSSLAGSMRGNQTLTEPHIAQDNAATPNTLFNQFFGQYPAKSPAAMPGQPAKPADPSQELVNLDELFNFDPAMYSQDPSASWLNEPMQGGLAAWPVTYERLEGERDLGDWQKMLGFS